MIKPYQALATDYDGTLAHRGAVSAKTLAAIHRLRASGKKLLLVTGRRLEELKQVFPDIGLCDFVVAENGALLYWPTTGQIKVLAEPAPAAFAQELRALGVPVAAGRVIVATVEPHEITVLQTIKAMRLEMEVIFNKGSVMVLPTGVNKHTGSREGLSRLGLDPLRKFPHALHHSKVAQRPRRLGRFVCHQIVKGAQHPLCFRAAFPFQFHRHQ